MRLLVHSLGQSAQAIIPETRLSARSGGRGKGQHTLTILTVRVIGGSGTVGTCLRGRSRRTQGLLVWLIHGVSSRLIRPAHRAKK